MTYVAPIPTNFPKAAVEDYAERCATTLGVGAGDPLEPVVEKLGGRISFASMNEDERDGGSVVASSANEFTIYLSSYTSPVRDRFTIAHELGHVLLHLPILKEADPNSSMRATRWVDHSDPVQQRAEWEANWFAAGFLMPKGLFLSSIGMGAEYLAKKFNVSRKAAELRIARLS
ncbi:MAG: ImmA/IrrE family metallo-endopeptidase [Pseudomonadota bacterium]